MSTCTSSVCYTFINSKHTSAMEQSTKPPGKSWQKVNRELKEKRKKWREERLVKKVCLNKEINEEETNNKSNKDKICFEVRKVSTVSIAVPGSILDNAQTDNLRNKLASQIARAACIYQIDEIIVYDDQGAINDDGRENGELEEARAGCLQLARLLQYCECPQYLRKAIFPQHKDLERVGVLDPLNAPHHLKLEDESLFREGIVTNKPIKVGRGSLVFYILLGIIAYL